MLYGRYPQFMASTSFEELDNSYYNGMMTYTDRYFTVNKPTYFNDHPISPEHRSVLRYKDKEYVYAYANLYDPNSTNYLLGWQPIEANYYCIEVAPITWLVDLKARVLVSKYGLMSGIRLGASSQYDGNFYHSEIKYFLDTFMAREISAQPKVSILDKNQELQDMMLKPRKIKQLHR